MSVKFLSISNILHSSPLPLLKFIQFNFKRERILYSKLDLKRFSSTCCITLVQSRVYFYLQPQFKSRVGKHTNVKSLLLG